VTGAEILAQVIHTLRRYGAEDVADALDGCVLLTAGEAETARAALHNCASLLLAAGVPLDDLSQARTALALLTPPETKEGDGR
jgi:hypothetical protein